MMTKEEGYFPTYDGLNLFYRVWLADTQEHPVFLIHGLHEHSGRYARIIEKLNLPQFSYFSFDQRGHGLSPGERGYALGVDEFLKDIDAFWNFALFRWPSIARGRAIWYGHSFGGLWVVRFAMNWPDRVKAVVLSSPCFGIRNWLAYLDHFIASFAFLFPGKGVHSFVFRKLLSHDPLERNLHKEDPHIHNRIGLVLLKDALKVMPETVRRAPEFKRPLLLLVSGSEYVVKKRQTLRFFERSGSAEKELRVFPGFYHELLREKEWQKPVGFMRDFLLKYSKD